MSGFVFQPRDKGSKKWIGWRATLGAKRREAKGRGWVDPDSWSEVLRWYDWKCAYGCGRDWEQQGHVVALSRGGAHHISNVVPTCLQHNMAHGTRTVYPPRRHPFMEAL